MVHCGLEYHPMTAKTPLMQNVAAAVAALQSLAQIEPAVDQAADLLVKCLENGGKVLACGNGGSAADAAHFTTELVCRLKEDRRPFPAICLASHTGDLTAIANDYGYDHVFDRQIHAFAQPGDLLIALSTSGNSPNVLAALKAAKKLAIPAISLLGRDGGTAKGLARVELIVPADDTTRIQEAHKLILHTLCQCVDQRLCGLN